MWRSRSGATRSCSTSGGALRARALDEPAETIECGLVLRSVGYRAVPLPGVPFDERSFVLPNERGRVVTPNGEPLAGVYAVGWIKRGRPGSSARTSATPRRRSPVSPRTWRRCRSPRSPSATQIDALLAERAPGLVTADGWRAIDVHELEQGLDSGRPRVKLASRDELLAAAAGTASGSPVAG